MEYSEAEKQMLREVLPGIAVQLRGALANIHGALGRLAPERLREQDTGTDRSAAILCQSYYKILRVVNNLSDAPMLAEDKPLGTENVELVELLEAQGIRCERKSVYSDIEALGALGYDIKLRRGRGGGYFLASRTFDLAELKLLVDAVQASRVVSGTTSRRLIHKLEKLCSNYEGSQLQRQVYVEGRPKTDSKSLLYSIDALHEAINNGKMVEFLYRKADSREKEKRTVSPWQLAWENGCYYLIAFADEKGIRHYRVDKMSGVRVLDAPRRGQEQFADLDLPAYLRKHFGMYGGPEHRVTLRCTADLEGAMRERFGATPMFLPEENGCFHFDVPICVSDQFYGWVCGFGGKIKVVAPPEVRQGMREMTARLAEQHQ